MVRLRVINVLRREMSACRKIIAGKVAEKGNRQQRGCSLSRKWSHTRSRCKIDAVYFPKGTAPKCGAEVEAKSAAIAVQASSSQQRHRRHQSGEREKPGSGVLPRCIFILTMNEVLHRLSKYDCRWRYAMQP